ncbi:ABC transporter permease [Frankia sp. AgKG'84/4]|uniref:ABC transporter permease n=1 Tax=Frankia sp. AgKG'84/4 TaxID=573490 RepID=UPI002029FD89|nr:ABC transporter permease [Frankia sp. AgKG'84/4]MCL9796443.1 ABC transporter permease [Frankia sp. AgKG'84/4]
MALTPTVAEASAAATSYQHPPASPGPPAPPGRAGTRALPGWLARAGRQLAGSLAVLLSVVTVTFLVTRVLAPDPVSLFLGSSGGGASSADAQAAEMAKIRARLGLDESIPAQYLHFLGQLVHGDLGRSFQTGRPVSSDLWSRLPATAELAVYSLLLGIVGGIVAGVVSAVRRGRAADVASRLVTIGALAMPQFWIGLMLLWIFHTKLHLAPGPAGRLPIGTDPPGHLTGFYLVDSILRGRWSTAADATRQLVLPVLTLAAGLAAPISKVVRASMVEALAADYTRTAIAAGFGRRRIWFVYALKNGLLPVLTMLANVVAFTFVGSILVEGVFGWPGIGNYAVKAIGDSDFPAVQGFVLYATVLYVVIYELLAVAYRRADPRVRS